MENSRLLHPGLSHKIETLSKSVAILPESEEDRDLDFALATCAAQAAIQRHSGTIEALWGPHGQFYLQYGKDLTEVKHLIGTGGIFIHYPQAQTILQKVLFSSEEPFSLRPKSPALYTDAQYCLFAVGLLADRFPDQALRVAKKSLKKWN